MLLVELEEKLKSLSVGADLTMVIGSLPDGFTIEALYRLLFPIGTFRITIDTYDQSLTFHRTR